MSRVPWNFGGGPVSIRLRSLGHCARQVRQVRRTRVRELPKLGAHLVISRLISVFVAMMIFLIASMDNPFRREFSVPPDAFARFRLQPTLFT